MKQDGPREETSEAPILDSARRLHRLGWTPMPIRRGNWERTVGDRSWGDLSAQEREQFEEVGKRDKRPPVGFNWKEDHRLHERRLTEGELEDHFGVVERNLAVVMKDGLYAVDFDNESVYVRTLDLLKEAAETLPELLDFLNKAPKIRSRRGLKVICRAPTGREPGNTSIVAGVIDIRGPGSGYVLVEPSQAYGVDYHGAPQIRPEEVPVVDPDLLFPILRRAAGVEPRRVATAQTGARPAMAIEEPFYDPTDGRLKKAVVHGGGVEVNAASSSWRRSLWPLPESKEVELQAEWKDAGLRKDIVAYIRRHLDLPEERQYGALADWMLASWLPERARSAPRAYFQAPTASGKSRALAVLRQLSYRGVALGSPTAATLYRLIEEYHVTALIDEYQALHPEARVAVDAVVRMGFEPDTPIPRCNEKGKVEIFDAFGFLAIASKDALAEDMLNRGLQTPMRPARRRVARTVEKQEAGRLRGRILAWRLAVLRGEAALPVEEAEALAEEADLTDRGHQIAVTLLQVSLPFGEGIGTLEVIRGSEDKAAEELLVTPEANVARALLAIIDERREGDKRSIPYREIRQELLTNLVMNEGWEERAAEAAYQPRLVGNILRQVLGFSCHRENDGYHVDIDGFEETLEGLRVRYAGKQGTLTTLVQNEPGGEGERDEGRVNVMKR